MGHVIGAIALVGAAAAGFYFLAKGNSGGSGQGNWAANTRCKTGDLLLKKNGSTRCACLSRDGAVVSLRKEGCKPNYSAMTTAEAKKLFWKGAI